jgi:Flp pilus assembly protein TadD
MLGRVAVVIFLFLGTVYAQVGAGPSAVTLTGNGSANSAGRETEVSSEISQTGQARIPNVEPKSAHTIPASSLVSVSDLHIPSSATRDFEKAERLIAKQEWEKAAGQLRKGLAIYPSAAAYNNLGAVYSQMGNNSDAREALQKALALDDRLAQAYVNLGRLSFLDGDYPSAEFLLSRATSLAPATNADELLVLAYAQLADKHLSQAIATSRQGHVARINQHARLHLVAANAYEKENRIGDSIAELELYLNEEPTGPRAETARKALAGLEALAAVR